MHPGKPPFLTASYSWEDETLLPQLYPRAILSQPRPGQCKDILTCDVKLRLSYKALEKPNIFLGTNALPSPPPRSITWHSPQEKCGARGPWGSSSNPVLVGPRSDFTSTSLPVGLAWFTW